ncbi:hypothetical protein PSD17_24480 [Pseudonocardia sp. D17]|nr:hypothetical protein PSD17_24480 [Pseudonocardia sp. D17]
MRGAEAVMETVRREPARGLRLVELARVEALALLGEVSLGRVVFTDRALPAVRLVNHVVDRETVIIRTHLGSALLSTAGEVVAYEADAFDLQTHEGWSVVVTGTARIVRDEKDIARYEQLLRPWVDQHMEYVIGIRAAIVTGYRIVKHDRDLL